MNRFSNPILINAHALPTDIDEPHAQAGNHLRVATHPELGLPVAPFIVHRAIAESRKGLNTRQTATFLDKNDQVVSLPFTVTPDNPLRIEIVRGADETCIWAQVNAVAEEDRLPDRPNDPTIPFDPTDPVPTEPGPSVPTRPGDPVIIAPVPERPDFFDPILSRPGTGFFRPTLPGLSRPNSPGTATGGSSGGSTGAASGTINSSVVGGVIGDFLASGGFARIDGGSFRIPDILLPTAPAQKLTIEAFVTSRYGLATIGKRSDQPYAISGPGIEVIEVTGWGRVSSIRWIEAKDPQRLQWEPFAIMNLPHPGGPRYLPIANWEGISNDRVDDQAPKRRPLQETVNAPAPAAAPLADIPFERQRVKSLSLTMAPDLDKLITDLSQDPLDQVISVESTIDGAVLNEDGTLPTGTATMARMDRFMQLQADPGTASRIGYKMRDRNFVEVEDRIIFYAFTGFFEDFPLPMREGFLRTDEERFFDSLVAQVPVAQRTMSLDTYLSVYQQLSRGVPGLDLPSNAGEELLNHDRYMMLNTIAVADRLAILDPVDPVSITGTTDKGWLPAPPPTALREIQVDVTGARVAGLLAAGKRTPATGTGVYANLNKKNSQGFHLPLMLGLNIDDESGEPVDEPGVGFVGDRMAEAPVIRYLLSQQDRFGRWSNWTSAGAPAGVRPKPPIPHLQGFYEMPSIADAPTTGGTVTVHVPVPDPESLAPASNLLRDVVITARTVADADGNGPGVAFTRTITALESSKVAVANPPDSFRIEVSFEGPILAAATEERLELTAVWRDTALQTSLTSDPQRLRLADPRPPAQPPILHTLLYSARPDVTGLAWVEYQWTPAPGQTTFGIYYTDENRMRSHLGTIGRTDLLDALDAAADAAVRATIYRTNQGLFPDHLFERLRNVETEYSSGEKGFRHAVSGSLRVLNCYKIAAESSSGAKPVLTDLDIVLFGVPNSDPPSKPRLTVRPAEPTATEPDFVAELDISMVVGVTEGLNWRLRRTQTDASNINRIPVVQSGALDPVDTDTGIQTAIYRDTGPVEIAATATLKPWVRYSWVAEVQGAPESGSSATPRTVPGRWSAPSDPVSLILVPEDAPVPVAFDTFIGTAAAGGLANLRIALTHPGPLNGAAMGYFAFRVERRLPDGAMTILREVDVIPDDPLEVDGTETAGEIVPFDTEFRITLIDPVGRASTPLVVTLV
ncbi:MAG: hypothetical protein AAGK98_07560 [Pseudomonadota bacterium]